MKKYDYIITGGGAAGLSLLVRMIDSAAFKTKQILLIDQNPVKTNDRTWCFWEDKKGLFEPIVSKSWSTLDFHTDKQNQQLSISPYQYKMIRSIDFYNYAIDLIDKQDNIDILNAEVLRIRNTKEFAIVETSEENFGAAFVFNSILWDKPKLLATDFWLLQHFKGWVIKTCEPVFNPGIATFMDFRVSQNEGTSFVYVLPVSTNTALVEYTQFTNSLLEKEEYDKRLRAYINQYLTQANYEIIEQEFGIIPMTNYRFKTHEDKIINIGTAGGDTKSSSGFTFQFIQKRTSAIVESLIKKNHPYLIRSKLYSRFHLFDSVLLHILHYNKMEGRRIFELLFKHNPPQQILKFLDNDTTLLEDLNLVSSLPKFLFINVTIKELYNRLFKY